MTIEIRGPDGIINRFPDGTSDDIIKGAMAKQYGAPSPRTGTAGTVPRNATMPVHEAPKPTRTFVGDMKTAYDNFGAPIPDNANPGFLAAGRAFGAINDTVKAGGGVIGRAIAPLFTGGGIGGKSNAPAAVKTENGVKYYRWNDEGDWLPVPHLPNGYVDEAKLTPRPNVSVRHVQDHAGDPLANLATFLIPGAPEKKAAEEVASTARNLITTGREVVPMAHAAQDLVPISEAPRLAPKAPPRAQQPRPPVTRPGKVKKLQGENILLTPGQILGGTAQKVEDSVATMSTAVGDARRAQNEQLTRAVTNRVLKPIGERLDPATPISRDSFQEMHDKVGGALDKAMHDATFKPDEHFHANMKDSVEENLLGMASDTKQELMGQVQKILSDPLKPGQPLTGKALSDALGRITHLEMKYKSNPNARAIGDFFGDLKGEVIDQIARNGGGDAEAIRNARDAYRLSIVAEHASSMRGAEDSVMNANQFQAGVAKAATGARGGKRMFASGRAPMQDLSDPAVSIMAPKIGSTGTTERSVLGRLVTGGGPFNPANWALAAGEVALKVVYSKPVLQLINGVARAKSADEAAAAAAKLQEAAKTNPEAAKALREILDKLRRASAASGAANAASGLGGPPKLTLPPALPTGAAANTPPKRKDKK